MDIMYSRLIQLEYALKGYQETGLSLVGINGTEYTQAGATDDVGIYYFIPKIADSFGIPLESAIDLFFHSLLYMGTFIAILFFFLTFRNWAARLISSISFILLMQKVEEYSEVYTISYVAVATIIPIYLYSKYRQTKIDWKFITCFAIFGLLIGYFNLIRNHSGTGVLLFLIAAIGLRKDLRMMQKGLILSTLGACLLIPTAHFTYLSDKRNSFLLEKNPSFQFFLNGHPKWHSIYIGLGYLKNDFGITYLDQVAYNKALSINPNVGYCSEEYDKVLRKECFRIFKKKPLFVLKNVFKKAKKIFLSILSFMFIGLIALIFLRISFLELCPFFLAIAFYAIPGILTIPSDSYVSGVYSTAAILALFMICSSMENMKNTLTPYVLARL